jgi:hypothetical protein
MTDGEVDEPSTHLIHPQPWRFDVVPPDDAK